MYIRNFIDSAKLATLRRFSEVYKQNPNIPEILARIRSEPLPTAKSGGVEYEAGPGQRKILHSPVDTFIRAIDRLIAYTEDDQGKFTNYMSREEAITEIFHIIATYNSSMFFPYLLEIREVVKEVKTSAAAPPPPLSLAPSSVETPSENENESPAVNARWAAVVSSPDLLRRKMGKKKHGGARTTQKAAKKKLVEINGGQKFHVEDASRNWTQTRRYKKWVGKLKRKHKAPRHTAEEDLCVGKHSICKNDLGIPRKYMPQFEEAPDIKRFTRFIKKAYHIKSRKTTRKATQLTPSQEEISRKRIEVLMKKEGIFKHLRVPLVISQDNYIVDGHHRWAAFRLKKPEKPLPVILIEAPIKDVLGIAVAWGAKHHEF
jgi:hypothetical protein